MPLFMTWRPPQELGAVTGIHSMRPRLYHQREPKKFWKSSELIVMQGKGNNFRPVCFGLEKISAYSLAVVWSQVWTPGSLFEVARFGNSRGERVFMYYHSARVFHVITAEPLDNEIASDTNWSQCSNSKYFFIYLVTTGNSLYPRSRYNR